MSLPSKELPPNSSSQSDACGLLTDAEVEQVTGAEVDRTSVVAGGCIWQGQRGGTAPIVDIRVKDAPDGSIGRVYDETQRQSKASGEVEPVDGIGDRAFEARSPAPAVWWSQGGRVYGLSVLMPKAELHGDAGTAAEELARVASDRVRE